MTEVKKQQVVEDEEENQEEERVQDKCIRLVEEFLEESGFIESLAALENESGRTLSSFKKQHLAGSLLNIVQQAADLDSIGQSTSSSATTFPELCSPPSSTNSFISNPAVNTLQTTHKSNVLCVQWNPTSNPNESHSIVSTSTDKTVVLTADAFQPSSETNQKWKITVPSSAIALDWNASQNQILVGTMGGTTHLLNSITGEQIQMFSDHKKYVISTKWLSNGRFITASHDHHIKLYAPKQESNSMEYQMIRDWEFASCIESMIPISNGHSIAFSIRDDNYIRTIDFNEGKITELLNMNSNCDDHVSFNALNLCYFGNRYLLTATDKDRLIMFDVGRKGIQVRNFWGASNDDMSRPCCCFSSSNNDVPEYVYETSQDNSVHVWEVASQREVTKLSGHKKVVRSLDFNPNLNAIVTASYDSTISIWKSNH